MTEAISGDGAAVAPGSGFDEDDDNDSHYSRDSHSLETADEAPNFAHNVRIKSKRFLRDYEADDEPGLVGEKNEDPVDLIMMTGNTGDAVGDGTAKPTNTGGGGGTAGGVGAGSAGAGAMLDDAKVPSRLAVKKLSSQVSIEARRKEEMEVRRKK